MKYRFSPYQHSTEAFLEAESFLASSANAFDKPRNWFIDRWNFTFTVSRVMHRASITEWEAAIGLWKDEKGRIVAMAHEEEQKGDVFFEFDRPDRIQEDLLLEMFAFAEKNCVKKRDGSLGFGLRIPRDDALGARLAALRGYRKGDWSEPMAVRAIPFRNAENPGEAAQRSESALAPGFRESPKMSGLTLIEGSAVSPDRKAFAHARAFGYADQKDFMPHSEAGFRALLAAPSYRPELDLALEDAEGNIVCFVGLWFDPVSKSGILEPVGTVPEYRKQGLGKFLIAEGEKRLERLGATNLYVGSNQPFYLAIGFRVIIRQDVWEYRR